MFYYYVTCMVFFLYKRYWVISNYWISPSHKRNFEVRNNISKRRIESFYNFLFIIYVFILFKQRYFWIINRLVRKERFDRFPVSFIASYILFVQTTILLFLSISLECNTVLSLFIITSFVFFNFFFVEFIPKSCSRHNFFRKSRFIKEE